MAHRNDKILGKLRNRLSFLEYADSSIDSYCYYAGLFLEFADKPFSHITKTDAHNFLFSCVYNDSSAKNQIISSLKQLFLQLKNTELDGVNMQRPRKKKKLPRVIHDEELAVKLDRIPNMKHRAMLTLGYRCGLRVSEVCSLRLTDVDTQATCIMVRDSKFNKDRQIPISQDTIQLLMWYCEEYDPCDYLFEGQNGKYSVSSCQKIFKKYIDANGSWHVLRHSYATTLVEKNVNMRVIQSALGHESSRTSEIYTHVSRTALHGAML